MMKASLVVAALCCAVACGGGGGGSEADGDPDGDTSVGPADGDDFTPSDGVGDQVDTDPGGTAPTVTLASSSTNVTAAGNITLTASVTSAVAVTKVEFFEGSTKLGEDTTSPYEQLIPYVEASNGAHTYFARATDANALVGTSNNVGVSVDIGTVTTFDYYVDPQNGSDTANGTSAATAFKSLCKVKAVATAGNHIALMDGVHDFSSSGFCQVTFANQVHLAAVNNGAAIVEVPLILKAAGSLKGLKLRNGASSKGGIQLSGTTAVAVTMSHITFGDISRAPGANDYPVLVGGPVTLTWQAVGDDVFTVPAPAVGASWTVAQIANNSAHLTVIGGSFDTFDGSSDDPGCNPLFLTSQGRLTLSGVDISHKGTLTEVAVARVTLDDNTTYINRSTSAAAHCHAGIAASGLSTVELDNATITGGTEAITADSSGTTITVVNGAKLEGFLEYGIHSNVGTGGGQIVLNLANATVHGSTAPSRAPVGVWVSGVTLLTARNTTFSGNDVGVMINAHGFGSAIDLGTENDGGNHFEGNTTTGVRVAWNPAPTGPKYVAASGNFWNAGVQGAVGGAYNQGTADVGAEAGQNYTLVGANDGIDF